MTALDQPAVLDQAPAEEFPVTQSVPASARNFSSLDMFLTWAGFNANTGSWFIGGLAASLGLGGALGVILLANPPAYILVALIGYMAFRVGTTTYGLARPSLGIRGAQVASALNFVQYTGWAVVDTAIGAIALSFLFNGIFGWAPFGAPGAESTLAIGVTLLAIIQAVPVIVAGHKSIRIAQRVTVTTVIALVAWTGFVLFQHWDLAAIAAWQPPAGVALPLGVVVDIFAVYSVTWYGAIGALTRFGRTPQAATVAPFAGASLALFWFGVVGTFGVIAGALATGVFDPNASDPSSVLSSLGLGYVAMLILILLTVSTNVGSLYIMSYEMANIRPGFNVKAGYWGSAILVWVASFIPIFMGLLAFFLDFLTTIGAVFGPVCSIMLVDYFILRKQRYDWSQSDAKEGPYWYGSGFNWAAIVVWIVGALSYFLFMGTPSYLKGVIPWGGLDVFVTTTGGLYPAMILSAVLYYIGARLAIARGSYKP